METHPQWYDVVLGSAAVIAGCVIGSAAFLRARRGAWPAWILGLGALLFVAGVAGQRTFPTADQVHRLGDAAATSPPGPWDAGVSLPLLGLRMTPVAVIGILVGLAGLALLLLLDHPIREVAARPATPARDLAEEDTA